MANVGTGTGKRGRKSEEDILNDVAAALKMLEEFEWLEESPLGRMAAVQRLAQGHYRRGIFPTASALRYLLLQAAENVVADLGAMGVYQREVRFIQAYTKGCSVADISRNLGLSREHVARTIQPRAVGLVARAFMALINSGEHS